MFIRIIILALALFLPGASSNAAEPKNSVFEIDFSVKATAAQEKDFKNKIVPWASIKNSESDSVRLIDPNRKVINAREATLVIEYPLRQPVNFRITSENGFTKAELLRKIGQIYREIYKDEEASSTVKTTPMAKRGNLINRNTTDGKYGIWGHDIDDLVISSATVSCNEGKCVIELGIDS